MKRDKRKINQGAMLLLMALVMMPITALAANDSSIKGDLRTNIKASMQQYIQSQTIHGEMYLYDSLENRLLKLKLDSLHDGIVKKGDYYVSCADFVDQKNRKVDIDFMVRGKAEQLITMQAIVHAVDGSKRKYQLEELD